MQVRTFSLLILCACLNLANAQTPAVKHFDVERFGNTVVVDWTISSGFQCSDIQVLFGTDSNMLFPVHTEFGICGNDTADEAYQFLHNNPATTKIEYYRLKVGFNEYSELVKQENILLQDFVIFPNPAREIMTVGFDAGLGVYDIIVVDQQGRRMITHSSRRGPLSDIDLRELSSGQYILSVLKDGAHLFSRTFIRL